MLKPIETHQYDVRLTLIVPNNNSRVIIEGDLKSVSMYWDNVKTDFINSISDVLRNQPFTKGDFVPVEIERKDD